MSRKKDLTRYPDHPEWEPGFEPLMKKKKRLTQRPKPKKIPKDTSVRARDEVHGVKVPSTARKELGKLEKEQGLVKNTLSDFDKILNELLDGELEDSPIIPDPIEYSISDEELELSELYKEKESKAFKEAQEDFELTHQIDTLIDKSRVNFYTFVKLMIGVVLPEDFIDGRHIEILCNELEKAERSIWDLTKQPQRTQIFLPPGSTKSKIASNLFPAWCLGRHPNWCFLAVGTTMAFAIDNIGRPVRDILMSPQYQAIFPETVLRRDVQAAGRWDTTLKGRFVCAGVGTSIVGRRGHIVICDDVVSEQTAYSKAEREKINKWYVPGLRTRLLPRAAEIIVNTRWALDDLSGHMERMDARSSRPWNIVKIPAILDEEASKLMRRKGDPEGKYMPGTSYWPEYWSLDMLMEKKESADPFTWNALYQQTPIPEDGGLVKRSYFRLWETDVPPECKFIIATMDTAFKTKETSDYSAITVWGVFAETSKDWEGNVIMNSSMVLLSAQKGRWDFPTLIEKTKEIDSKFKPDFFIVEDKASGQTLIPEMTRYGLPVMPYMPAKDKMTRLHFTLPFFMSGRIWIPKNKKWVDDFIDEIVSFPNVAHDDFVDCLTSAILWLRDSYNIDNDNYVRKLNEPVSTKKHQTYWSGVQRVF